MFGSDSHYWQQKCIGLNISHGIMGLNFINMGKSIEVAFQPLPLADIMATVKAVHDEPDIKPPAENIKEPHPTFEPHLNTNVADFNFQKEVEHCPFKLN